MTTRICMADPNVIFCQGLDALFKAQSDYRLEFYTPDGDDLLERLQSSESVPEMCLISPMLSLSNGESAIRRLNDTYPAIKSIALCDDTLNIDLVQLLELGVKAQIQRKQGFTELIQVINQVKDRGFFYDAYLDAAIAEHFNHRSHAVVAVKRQEDIALTERQKEFIRYCCSEMNYKEIATRMGIRPSTALKFREIICDKLHVKTRMGIMMYALEYGLYEVHKMSQSTDWH